MRAAFPRLLLLGLFVALAFADEARAQSAAGPFYTIDPAQEQGRPGELIRSEPMAGAPTGATAFRVLYRSTSPSGDPIAVSGIVVAPAGPPPAEGRPVVAWAHPTTGVVPSCAPSLLANVFARGYVVAATDYPGLGTAGPHPYLVGISSASARAGRSSTRFAPRVRWRERERGNASPSGDTRRAATRRCLRRSWPRLMPPN
jgi:hypothetical protein